MKNYLKLIEKKKKYMTFWSNHMKMDLINIF